MIGTGALLKLGLIWWAGIAGGTQVQAEHCPQGVKWGVGTPAQLNSYSDDAESVTLAAAVLGSCTIYVHPGWQAFASSRTRCKTELHEIGHAVYGLDHPDYRQPHRHDIMTPYIDDAYTPGICMQFSDYD